MIGLTVIVNSQMIEHTVAFVYEVESKAKFVSVEQKVNLSVIMSEVQRPKLN